MPIPEDISRSQLKLFANVASGWYPFATARSLDPERGPCWRKAVNVRWHDGVVEKRRSVVPAAYRFNDVVTDSETDAAAVNVFGYPESGRIEYPMYMTQIETRTRDSSAVQIATILVTNTDIYILDPAVGWTVATPTYSTGTITYESGDAVVTGTGTAWSARHISPSSHIRINGKWLRIATVVSDTEIEVDPAPDGAGQDVDYIIRRSFGFSADTFDNHMGVHVTLHNGDLYVAGTNVGGNATPAVVRVRHFTADPQPGQYLMASKPLVSTIDTFENLLEINGMVNLPDGRVMLATVEVDPDTSGSGEQWLAQSRIRYSSHLDVFEWVEQPAGFVDDVSGGTGRMTALAAFGRSYTAHYRDSITLASLTGQDEPPVALSSTRAHIGTGAFRTIRIANGNQVFVGHDGAIYRFNGLYTEQISNAFRDRMDAFKRNAAEWWLFSGLDEYRNEYQVYMRDFDSPKAQTECFSLNYSQQFAPRWELFPVDFWCVSERFLGSISLNGVANSTREWAAGFGVTKINAAGDAVKQPFFRFREFFPEDITTGIDHTITDQTEPIELQTDDLHFGWPGQHQKIERVILWMRMRKDAIVDDDTDKDTKDSTVVDTIEVSLSSDSGTTWSDSKTASVTYVANSRHVMQQVHFTFEEAVSAEQHRIRIRSTNLSVMYGAIADVAIRYQTTGETEATGDEVQAA